MTDQTYACYTCNRIMKFILKNGEAVPPCNCGRPFVIVPAWRESLATPGTWRPLGKSMNVKTWTEIHGQKLPWLETADEPIVVDKSPHS